MAKSELKIYNPDYIQNKIVINWDWIRYEKNCSCTAWENLWMFMFKKVFSSFRMLVFIENFPLKFYYSITMLERETKERFICKLWNCCHFEAHFLLVVFKEICNTHLLHAGMFHLFHVWDWGNNHWVSGDQQMTTTKKLSFSWS